MYEQVQKRNNSSSSSTSKQSSSSVQRQARKAKETQSKGSNSTKAVDSAPTNLMQPLAAPAPLGGEETAEAVRQGVKASKILPGNLKFSTKVPFIKRGSKETQQVRATPLANDETQQVRATPLADDELLLDHNQDSPPFVLEWFRGKIGNEMNFWQLPFTNSDVQMKLILFGREEKKGVILKWNESWGQKPISSGSSSLVDIEAIEARASVAAVHKLQGWGKLDSSSQTILNGIFGGETNQLSSHSRNKLQNSFASMRSKSATDQEEILRDFITSKASIPEKAKEPLTSEKVEHFVAAGPVKRKDYAFQNKTADAERWQIGFNDDTLIEIVAPKAPEPGYHNHTVDKIADAASHLPEVSRSLIEKIVLEPVPNSEDAYWATKYNMPGASSAMAADSTGLIRIFPTKETVSLPDKDSISSSMIHETGHIWSRQKWGEDVSKGKWLEWKDNMNADKVSVSDYAMTDIKEDVAETIRAYTSTKGSASFEEYRQIVPNRFAMLDKEYK